MAAKIITVVGATGAQGGSVVDFLLKNNAFKVRALTRNPDSDTAMALVARGAEIVKADANGETSLLAAFQGSHATFAVTDFFEPFGRLGAEKAIEIEVQQGINLAKTAAATSTLEHYIWSTLPDAHR